MSMLLSGVSQGQRTSEPRRDRIKHQQIRADLAPGVAGYRAQMQNPKLVGHVQPVRVIGPQGVLLSIWTGQGFSPAGTFKANYGMSIGPVYRMKVENIPNRRGKEIFPSIELVNKLQPPEGLEQKFPIEIVLTQDDLEEAIAGRFVTKVVYLENPEVALPVRQRKDDQRSFDVGLGEDPYRTADGLGRPMAIIRIGSRAPIAGDATDQFGFDNANPVILPFQAEVTRGLPPQTRNWQSLDEQLVNPPMPQQPNSLPPIVSGRAFTDRN